MRHPERYLCHHSERGGRQIAPPGSDFIVRAPWIGFEKAATLTAGVFDDGCPPVAQLALRFLPDISIFARPGFCHRFVRQEPETISQSFG